MKLVATIKQTGTKRTTIGLFLCPYCKETVERTLRNGVRTKSCGCMKNHTGKIGPEKCYLGPLCKYGHEYQNTGKSLRYKTNKGCIACRKKSNQDNKKGGKLVNGRQDRTWAVLHCAKYQDCLDRAIDDPDFKMNCKRCEESEEVINCFHRELADFSMICTQDTAEHKVMIDHREMR